MTASHMSPDEFRALGHRAVDWIADYMRRVEGLEVSPRVEPGDVLSQLPEAPPDEGGADGKVWEEIFHDLERVILPGLMHWQSPNFYGYFPCNASGPAIIGEIISAGLNVNGMLWSTSPAATELELRVLDWMADMLGLPEAFTARGGTGGGVIQGTASESTLIALVAARQRARRLSADADERLVLYASEHAHSSVAKAAMIAGLADGPEDRQRVRMIPVGEEFAMRADLLREAIERDMAAGLHPFYVCATVGTTSTTAVDPLVAIGEALDAAGYRGWLHIDAAHAGAACICPEHRWMLEGIERADSLCFNPHKWLLTNFDCDCFWTKDRAALIDALSITPEYLRNRASESGRVIDYRDWQIPLGRRFRALKLWMVVRHYGISGLQAHVREHIRLAELFEAWVRDDDRFEIAAKRTVNLVCFRLRGSGESAERANRELLDRLNASGRIFLTHAVLSAPESEPRFVLRMAIGSPQTEERHIQTAWDLIRQTAGEVLEA